MTKRTKAVMLLGIISLLAPSVTYAQRQVVKSVKTASKISEIVSALQRAAVEREMAGGVGRVAVGAAKGAYVAPVVTLPKLVVPDAALLKTINTFVRKHSLTKMQDLAVRAGAQNYMLAVEYAVQEGAAAKFALFGAVVQGNFDLAGEIVKKYKVDMNSPLVGNKTIAELLPNLEQKQFPPLPKADERIVWMLNNGLDPNLVLTKKLYEKAGKQTLLQAIKTEGFKPDMVMESKAWRSLDSFYLYTGDIFDALVENGLNTMAADNNGFTALHWYAEMFYNGRHLSIEARGLDAEEKFLAAWVAKFPETNINAQDIWGNTPAHYVKAKYSKELDPFAYIRGFDPTILNDFGEIPEASTRDSIAWCMTALRLRLDIEDLILDYKCEGRPTATQKEEAKQQALAYLHNPQPEKLVDYLISLGAAPEIIEDRLNRQSWVDYSHLNKYWVRDEILDVLYEKYGVKRPNPKSKSTSRPDPYDPWVYENNSETDDGGWGFDDD